MNKFQDNALNLNLLLDGKLVLGRLSNNSAFYLKNNVRRSFIVNLYNTELQLCKYNFDETGEITEADEYKFYFTSFKDLEVGEIAKLCSKIEKEIDQWV